MTVLGDKLKNPYSVRNMKAAYQNLKTGNAGGRTSRVMEEDFSIRPTHYYVRFLPENQAAYDSLERDTSLFLLDRPIDVKVEKEANYYHDPSVPKDKPTWQYTSVPLSYKVPFGNKMEILDTLYLPEKVETQGGRISEARRLAMDVLENESLLLTDNLTEKEKKLREKNADATGRTQWFWNDWLPSYWTPAGHIRVWDERVNRNIAVMGAKVRAWRWFSTGVGWVNSRDGRYVCDNQYRYNVCYKIIWEGGGYDIRDGQWWQAYYNGPNFVEGDWDLDIGRGGKSYHYAHICRAIYAYNHSVIDIRKPQDGPDLIIAMRDTSSPDLLRGEFNGNWLDLAPTIHIYRYGGNTERECDGVFGTTVHELAHSAHARQMGIQFWQVSSFVKESWARAVQLEVTKEEYRALGIANYGAPDYFGTSFEPYFAGFQGNQIGRSSQFNDDYTAIFIDLMDNFNQRDQLLGNPTIGRRGQINDNVSGFTLPYTQQHVLPHAYGLTSLRNRLKEVKVAGVTDAQIDELFGQY